MKSAVQIWPGRVEDGSGTLRPYQSLN